MRRFILGFMVMLLFGMPLYGQEPIRIGVLVALSGSVGFIGEPSKKVAIMAADDINTSGGINGRPIQLIFADTESNPGKAALEAKRLIEKEKVVAIVGPTSTGSAMACLKIIQSHKTPTIGCVGGTPPVEPVRQYMFKTPQKTVTAVRKVYMFLDKRGEKRIAIMSATNKFGQEGRASLKRLAGEYGINIISDQTFDVTDTDVTVQLTKIKKTHPQAVVCWTIGGIGAIVARNFKQLDMDMPLIQCHGLADPKYVELCGNASEGTIMPSTKLMVVDQVPDIDPQKPILVRFKHEYEVVRHIGKVSAHSGYAWDAMQILAIGLRKTNGRGGLELAKAIEGVKGYVGVSGIYNMSSTDHCGLGVDSMVMIQVRDGKWQLVN